MTHPAFSICIPNYNYANYIGKTIQSVLDQTNPHFEIVVVDNASTDNSVDVIRSFRDERIHLHCNPYNVGFAPNLDRAASRASNPYIIVLSSDDLMYPNALESYAKLIEGLERPENALIVSAVDVIDGNGRKMECYGLNYYLKGLIPLNDDSLDLPGCVSFSGLQVFKHVYSRNMVPGHFCTTLYSKRLYESVGGYSSVNLIGPDAHLDYKILLKDARVIFVEEPLFAYRIHNQRQLNQSRQNKDLKIPIDRYLFSVQYTDRELALAGADRNGIQKFLVEDACLRAGFDELRIGNNLQAFRLFMFGFAAYPSVMLKNKNMYPLMLLLLLGPIGTLGARLIYKLRGMKKNATSE
jgi:glycosyltransferase involved in cell wall biosynthesis